MKELLSSEEIDTLLDMFRGEGAPGEAAAGPESRGGGAATVSSVDLLKPNRFSRDHMRSFERMFENIAKSLTVTLGDRLRIDLRCECAAVEQTRFQPWLKLVNTGFAIYVLRLSPFELPVPFAVHANLLYGAVDRILGGSGKVPVARQEFTTAEYTVADAVIGPCLDRLCSGLEDLAELSWSIDGRFCNASTAHVLPGQDVVLSVCFRVESDTVAGDMRIAIPHASLAPHLDGIEFGRNATHRMQPGSMRDTNAQSVGRVPLDLAVVLGSTEVPLRQLLQMQVGDVLPLRTRIGEPLVAPVQGKPKFLGLVGRRGSHLAFRVRSVTES